LRQRLISDSPENTALLGEKLGALLSGGEIIGIEGELGAGKTCFIQGLARGLGISQDQYVRSPTFTLINEYKGKIPLYHFDLYRLDGVDEIIGLGYEEYFWGNGVTAIEWFEKLDGIKPKELLRLEIKIVGELARELHFSCHGRQYEQILKRFFNQHKGNIKK